MTSLSDADRILKEVYGPQMAAMLRDLSWLSPPRRRFTRRQRLARFLFPGVL